MPHGFLHGLILIVLLVDQGLALGDDSSQHPLPDTGTVIRKMIERAGTNLTNQHAITTTFYRTNITEEYSSRGTVTDRTTTVKKITLKAGERTSELVQYNGEPPTKKRLEREAEREERRREGRDDHDAPDRSKQINGYLTQEILSRFVFTVVGRDTIDGRPCLMLSFKPGNGTEKSRKVFDRVIDQMGGMIWVDEEDYEMVKADIQLRERVKMWGGFLAVLDRIALKIQRVRSSSGYWYDRTVEARFSGRALTKRIDIMTWDFASDPVVLAPATNSESIATAQ